MHIKHFKVSLSINCSKKDNFQLKIISGSLFFFSFKRWVSLSAWVKLCALKYQHQVLATQNLFVSVYHKSAKQLANHEHMHTAVTSPPQMECLYPAN